MTENDIYGPLAGLIGEWYGDQGTDVSPEPDGDETAEYFETLMFEGVGDVDNAETQELAALRYHQVVTRKRDNKVFHNESGYLIWEAEASRVMQTLTIPRGVALVAGGGASEAGGGVLIEVHAASGDPDWPVAQSPFMRDRARVVRFDHRIQVAGDELRYSETTIVDIYGVEHTHTDENVLTRR